MQGLLQSWFKEKSYGFVYISFKETYFLHRTGIVEMPEGFLFPPVGSTVHFDVAEPRGKGAGKLPQAVNAKIIPPADSSEDKGSAR